MSSSKYSSLPDIDSAPDVYETPDVPAEFTHDRDSDSETEQSRSGSPTNTRRGPSTSNNQELGNGNENIDSNRLNASEARRRFGEASLIRRDENRTAGKRLPSRRLPNSDVYSSTGGIRGGIEGAEKETTIERLRRLRSEVEELEEDVKKEALIKEKELVELDSNRSVVEGGSGKGKKREISPAVILQQIQMLRGDLGIIESVGGVLEGNGEREEDGMFQRVMASSNLLSKLGHPLPEADSTKASTSSNAIASSSQNIRVVEGDLEKRLAEIERVVGANESSVDESNPLPTPLLHTITRLDHLLTLLTQPRHLDSISRRVKVLVSDLERLHDSRRKLGDTRPVNIALAGGMTVSIPGTGGEVINSIGSNNGITGIGSIEGTQYDIPPDALQKIDSLFSLLPRLDPLLPLTPRLLSRLRSLATLHSSAANFGETLNGLKDEISRLGDGEKGLREVLEGLEGNLKENEGKVKGNLEGLEGRLKSLVERLDKLN